MKNTENTSSAQVLERRGRFVDPRRMREAFLRTFGLPPQAFRRTAREKAA